MQFEARIARDRSVTHDIVRERVYGDVRVTADWNDGIVTLDVSGEFDRRGAPAYVELFFHDVFLLLNLAAPGSFDGTIAIAGGELRVHDLTFHPFTGGADRLPIERVTAWFDSLQLGTRQVASSGVETALFELLHLARGAENEEVSILRLARAAEALLGRPESLRRLFELRDEMAQGSTPVFHPMHDDALDPRIEDATREWIDVADAAASAIVRALQDRIESR
ncbi:MAG: hypothetical protein ACJ74H_04965 [Thermoanaerobaculia bacterium]